MPRRPEQFKELREKSREKILAAALELFANKGYEATSIESIAKKAGISKGLIYNYYQSKKSILLEILKDVMKIGEDMVLAQQHIKDPHERMKGMVEGVFGMMDTQPEYLKLLTVMSLQPGVMAETKDFTRKAYKQSQEWSKRIQGNRGKKGVIEYLLIGALLDGIVLNFIMYGKDYPLEALKKEIIKEYCTPKTSKPK